MDPLPLWRRTSTHAQTHISLTHDNCISCQMTVNKICHIPDVDVLFLPWGGFSCMRFHEKITINVLLLWGFFWYIQFFWSLGALKLNPHCYIQNHIYLTVFSYIWAKCAQGEQRCLTVPAVCKKIDFISYESKTGGKMNYSCWGE